MIEVRRLREILQTKKYLRLIAGSPFYLDTVLDYAQPFFEFFKVKRLDGLNEEESRTLLLKLGDIYGEREKIERIIKETPQRIETLRILSSGVPRTIALLFQIFIDDKHESSLKDLMRILDAVTPLYKHRMDDLPTQQQKIVDAVARNWDAISVKELRERTKLESKVISAQLRQLEKNQVIEKRETGTKNHLYILQDRFWNIWYLMRNGRKKESERVVWLVRFLESWCTNDDFDSRINNYVIQFKKGELDENAKEIFGQVYSSLKNLTTGQKYLLKKNTPKNISVSIIITENEAEEEALNLSKEKRHFDAVKILLESKHLAIQNKIFLSSELNAIEIIESLNFGKEYLTIEQINYYKHNEGFLLFLLHMALKTITLGLVQNSDERVQNMIDNIPEMITDIHNGNMDYEFQIIGQIIFTLLVYKKIFAAKILFEKLDKYDLKNIIKPIHYTFIYYSQGRNSHLLKNYGREIIESASPIITMIEKSRIDMDII